MARRVFITVAEVSGDRHAAQLIHSLKQLDPEMIVEGLGGPAMQAAGAIIHRNTVARAAMGWRGALRAIEVYKALRWTRRHFQTNRPDVWIGVDSPSMNFHFARAAKGLGIPTLQYVAPQLWAWAPWRMKKLRKWVDRLACILPFEETYFLQHGVNATFVGHPLFDELPTDHGDERGARYPARPPIIGLLPGSRRSEAQANLPPMIAVAEKLREEFAGITFLVPTTDATDPVACDLINRRDPSRAENPLSWQERLAKLAGSTAERTGDYSREFACERDAFDRMVPCCDLCITVSGTATLHVASFGVPMIVVYRASWAVWNLAGRWLIAARTFALVNLLAARTPEQARPSRHLVPEVVPWYGQCAPVAQRAADFLRHPEKLTALAEQLRQLVRELDRPGASMEVARLALEMTQLSDAALAPASLS